MIQLPTFQISPKSDPSKKFFVPAKNAKQAWKKFVTQRFDALKPDPKEWAVAEAKPKAWHVVEKDNHLALHAICCSKNSALEYIRETVPKHCALGYFMDKTLTPDSFEAIPKY